MDQLLQFVRGPLFIMTFLFMILSLARLFVLHAIHVYSVMTNTEDTSVNPPALVRSIFDWVVPVKHLFRTRPAFSAVSFVWHIGLIVVPLLLVDHLLLWTRGLGLSTIGINLAVIGINRHIADVIVIVVIALTIVMFLYRASCRQLRAISEPMDYIIIVLLALPFITGFLAAHPSMNPVNYQLTMLIHILSAEAIFVLMPLTKLSHVALFPFGRISTEFYWKFPTGSGDVIASELFGEEAKV